MNIKANPHDSTFKKIIKQSIVAKDFFQQHLPDHVKKVVDFDTFKLCSKHFSDNQMNENFADVIYEAYCGDDKAYFTWVLEHKVYVEDLCFWALEKRVKVMARHREIHHTKHFPLVFILVVYHGQQPYPYSTSIGDYINAPRDLVDETIKSTFQLVDLNLVTDEQLRGHRYAGLLQYFQKHIREIDFLSYLQKVIPWLHELSQESTIIRT